MTTSSPFALHQGVLHAEQVSLAKLARQHGTPLYVYSRHALRQAWQSFQDGAAGRDVLVCYGMKANSNLAVLNEFRQLGAGFDIVSGGELARALAVGADPARIVFSGVGKQVWEMQAALEAGVKCFNVESEDELRRLDEVAQGMGRQAPVSLRVNPDVDAHTHPYISTGLKENKFGVAIEDALRIYQHAATMDGIRIVGVDCHIGSQITEAAPYMDALGKLIDLIKALADHGIVLHHLDLGGGLGIRYTDETPLAPRILLDQVFQTLEKHALANLQLILEPGRSLTGNAGVLLTTVQYLKHSDARNFAIVDAAMNDLLRPTLYEAWHNVQPVQPRPMQDDTPRYDVVGPVCESGDWLARDRQLALEQGDLLAIMSAGAYGFTMSSHYNSRPRAAEVMVDGDRAHVVRPRENIQALFASEAMLPD
ncbi:diaminopimelate decarboxylase [Allopusillimonas soli]|uniref:Diaminopimelate decarboxylase n=1 Tax=Allopusillimonas soli TaxID=659016 RepID=A0A853F9A1_9BURK|nr:diaminopimelate decarboxylase [Allopusillimonas soli]NYT37254.1 diaminopimelate decarboxylase [Allopusillimonas soli]TEA74749.1 diaminopimelate decarboxylase [Allopusillimonas soli]